MTGQSFADHPHEDPGDGRSECEVCGKFVWPVTHSCKGVPVTEAARGRQPTYRRLAFTCTAYGTPAAQGSKRHVGGGKMIEASKAVAPWREAVKTAARKVIDDAVDEFFSPLNGPLSVELVFTLRKPASAPKRRQTWPDRTPDLDKLVRSTFDALTDAGVWVDDARVVHLLATKCYPGEGSQALLSPGVVVLVRRVS